MRACVLAILMVATACNAGVDDDTPPVELGSIEIVPPTGWTSRELGPTTRMWTPAKNPGRESIVVIVAPKPLGEPTRAFELARKAQELLADARITATSTISTAGGRAGRRIDLSFRPTGTKRRYQRSHVSIVEGDSLIHVLYTAADPDPERAALMSVVASIRQGG